MTTARLGFSVDSSTVAGAIPDLDRLVAASGRTEKAVEDMSQGVSAALNKTGQDAERASDRIESAAMQIVGLRQMIDKSMNIRWSGGFVGDAAESAAAFGSELDRLRSRFNPIFAAGQNYRKVVTEIREAHRVGAISSGEMTAAIEREREATQRLVEAQRQWKVGLNEADLAMANQRSGVGGGRGYNTAMMSTNIMYQAQDTAITAAMGMSPLMIGMQQGMQIGGTLQSTGRGLAGLKEFGPALLAMVSPINLISVGLVTAAAAAIQYASTADEAKTLNDVLKEHEANIGRLGPAYDEARKRAQQFTAESAGVVERSLRMDKAKAAEMLEGEIHAALQTLKTRPSSATLDLTDWLFNLSSSEFGRGMLDRVSSLGAEFKPFEDLIRQLESGQMGLVRFREEVDELGRSAPGLDRIASKIIAATDAAALSAQQVETIVTSVDRAAVAYTEMTRHVEEFGTSGGESSQIVRQAMESISESVSSGRMSTEQLRRALEQLSGRRPDMSGAIAEFGELAEAAVRARNAIGQVSLAQGLAGQFSPDAAVKGGRVGSLTPEEMKARMDYMAEVYRTQAEFFRRSGELGDLLGNDKIKKPGADRDGNAYRQLIKNAQDRIDQMRQEIDLMGQTGAAAVSLRFEQELLANAMDRGRKVSPAQAAEIKKLADEFGRLSDQMARTQLQQDLFFERDQIMRSSIDQVVAATLRSAGLAVDLSSAEAQMIRLNEQLAIGRDLFGEFFSGLAADLQRGVSLTDALGNAFQRLGSRLLDIALDEAISALFRNLSGGGSSGGGIFGNLFGMVGGLFGFGGGGGDPWGGLRVASANGNVFSSSIVSRPTLFPMANGAGLMGEAGPEAIMPLTRDAQGRLGVRSQGASATEAAPHFTYAPSYQVTGYGQDIEDLKRQMARDHAEFEARSIRTWKAARAGRVIK